MSAELSNKRIAYFAFAAGSLMLGSYNTQARMLTDPVTLRMPVPIPLAILLMETMKLIISVNRLVVERAEKDSKSPLEFLKETISGISLREALPYAVPGLLYFFNNNLEVFMMRAMDPATARLLMNGKIITTAVIFRLVMGVTIETEQTLCLGALLCACILAAKPPQADAELTLAFITTLGIAYASLHCVISGMASVANEWLMKKGYGADTSIHLQNALLYCWGILFNITVVVPLILTSPEPVFNFSSLPQLANWLLFVANGCFHGLAISFVIKHLTSLHKLFMSSIAVYISGLLNLLLLGAQKLSAVWFASASIAVLATIGYNYPERVRRLYFWRAEKEKTGTDPEGAEGAEEPPRVQT